jgi:general secretion pathway protein G
MSIFPSSHPSPRRLRQRGFTLLELIVVITIIGLLAGTVVVATKGLPAKGRRTRIDRDLRQILTVAESMYLEQGRYPDSIEEMVNVKTEQGQDAMASLESYPKDPWNHEYVYELVDGKPRVTCLGVDNQPGGDNEAADVTLPAPEEGR